MAAQKRQQKVPVKWEKAQPGDYPILAYCMYVSSLPIFKTRQKRTSREKEASMQTALEGMPDERVDYEATETSERKEITVRLPYTRQALINRKSNGRSLPKEIEELIQL